MDDPELTFTPRVNPVSKEIMQRKCLGWVDCKAEEGEEEEERKRGENRKKWSDRLYSDKCRNEAHLEALRREREIEEMEECSFRPKITRKARGCAVSQVII